MIRFYKVWGLLVEIVVHLSGGRLGKQAVGFGVSSIMWVYIKKKNITIIPETTEKKKKDKINIFMGGILPTRNKGKGALRGH